MKKIVIKDGGFYVFHEIFSYETQSYVSGTQIQINYPVNSGENYYVEIDGVTTGAINIYDGENYIVSLPYSDNGTIYNNKAEISFFITDSSNIKFLRVNENITNLKVRLYKRSVHKDYIGYITNSSSLWTRFDKCNRGDLIGNIIKAPTDTSKYVIRVKPLFTGNVRLYYGTDIIPVDTQFAANTQYEYEVDGRVGSFPQLRITSAFTGNQMAFLNFYKK